MLKIFKYTMGSTDNALHVLKLPSGAKILDIQRQGDCPVLWAAVDPDAALEEVIVATYYTGSSMPTFIDHEHITTTQDEHGIVRHYFKIDPQG